MRLFACTHLGVANQAMYGRLIVDLAVKSGGQLRPVPERSLHVTHAFLAEAPAEAVAGLVHALGAVASGTHGFPIRLGPPSVRYAKAQPRLLDVRVVAGESEVERLTDAVSAALAGGLSPDAVERARSAHVTLARFSRRAGRGDGRVVEALLAADSREFALVDDRIAAVQLVSSALTPHGPVYTTLADFPLA